MTGPVRGTYVAHLRCNCASDRRELDAHGQTAVNRAIRFRQDHSGEGHHIFRNYPRCDVCEAPGRWLYIGPVPGQLDIRIVGE